MKSKPVPPTENIPPEQPIASFRTALHKMQVMPHFLVISKSFPPVTKQIPYEEIATVEHRRLIDYGKLVGVAAGIVLAYVFLYVSFIRDMIAALVLEVGLLTNRAHTATVDPSMISAANNVCFFIAAAVLLGACYYAVKFIFSLGSRLIIYRTGKKPISFPFPLTGASMTTLQKLHEKVESMRGISKSEAEQILGDQVRRMLDQRVKMQKTLVESLQRQLKLATTEEEKEHIKEMAREGVDKLEEQDQMIDQELKKTGLKKEDIFKKYRIKAPDESFIDSIMQGNQ